MKNKPSNKFLFSEVNDLEAWQNDKVAKTGYVEAKSLGEREWNLATGKEQELYQKLNSIKIKLGDISKIFVGLQTSADTVFLFKKTQKSSMSITRVFSKELNIYAEIETALLKEVVRSGEIGRFWINTSALVLFPYHLDGNNKNATLISELEMEKHYPLSWDYLLKNKKLLEGREKGKFKNTGWYQLYPKNLEMWEEDKIMLPYMIKWLSAFYDKSGKYFVNVTTGGFGLRLTKKEYHPLFITGLLNSNVLDWFLKSVSTNFNSGYFAANKQFLVQLPICIRESEQAEIVKLTDQLLKLNEDKAEAKLQTKVIQLESRINYCEGRINDLVYQLYGLTEEEIKIIEVK